MKKVKRDKAWMTDFNVQHNYSSPFRVEELMEDWALTHSAVVQVRMVIKLSPLIRRSKTRQKVTEHVQRQQLHLFLSASAIAL